MKELTCIICPRGCHLKIDDELKVTGNFCPRGAKYAVEEITNPKRTLTTTVKCNSEILKVLPVKTVPAIPKDKIFDCMQIVNSIVVSVPVKTGDIIVKDICGTGCDLVASRTLER